MNAEMLSVIMSSATISALLTASIANLFYYVWDQKRPLLYLFLTLIFVPLDVLFILADKIWS